jgi:hypothetical protein
MPEQQTVSVEVFILVDADGDSASGNTPQEAREQYEENVGALSDADGFRMCKVVVLVPLPAVAVLTGAASGQGETSLTEVS